MKKVVYKSPVSDGAGLTLISVQGERINNKIGIFYPLAIQRTIEGLHPLRFRKRSFIVVHIPTGCSISYPESTRKLAIESAKNRVSKKSVKEQRAAIRDAKKRINEIGRDTR